MIAAASSTVYAPAPHALELLAARALDRGDSAAAFRLADRYCRIAAPRDAHAYVILGEALVRLGHKEAALSNFAQALLLDPENLIGNRLMLKWGEADQQRRAATTLIKIERDFGELRKAINVFRAHCRPQAFGAVAALDTIVEGWALWQSDVSLEVTISNGDSASTVSFYSDRSHALSDFGHAASFTLRRPESLFPQRIVVRAGAQTICSTIAPRHPGVIAIPRPPRDDKTRRASVTAIVPIFEDAAATKACLDCLIKELDQDETYRAVLVDDATPNSKIKKLLQRVALHPRVAVLTNSCNLGFAGAVNRALGALSGGDVVLLNADTIPPRGFIARLSAAARSSPDIGVVMPLSNNGDLAGYPAPQQVAPLGSRRNVERIDRIAMAANAGQVVDIPNGVGFCLYITRPCLNKVGFLSESFGRGYFEDVEFSLRARDRGFRCVCAPSIYVGHAGSKSFGSERESLVARNSEILRVLYPKYGVEFSAFATADPLRPARQAISLAAGVSKKWTHVIVSGDGVVGDVAGRRARDLAAAGASVFLLEIRRSSTGLQILASDPAERPSQPLRFDLRSASDKAALRDRLAGANAPLVEFFDPARTPLELIDIFKTLKLRYNIAIADAGLLGRAEAASFLAIASQDDAFAQERARRGRCRDRIVVEPWRELVNGANKIVAMDEFGCAFGEQILPTRAVERIGEPACVARKHSRVTRASNGCIGFLPVRVSGSEFRLISAIVSALRMIDARITFVVIGATVNDAVLMEIDGVHVTGPVQADELESVAERYSIERVFVSATQPLFGHPLIQAGFRCGWPLAYFDWSAGSVKGARSDLPLNPDLSFDDLVSALENWMSPKSPRGARSRNRFQ